MKTDTIHNIKILNNLTNVILIIFLFAINQLINQPKFEH